MAKSKVNLMDGKGYEYVCHGRYYGPTAFELWEPLQMSEPDEYFRIQEPMGHDWDKLIRDEPTNTIQ